MASDRQVDLLPRPLRNASALLLLVIFAIGFAAIAGATAITATPSVWLEGATVERARALALDAALIKGWHLAESGRDFAIFETALDQPATAGPPDARPRETTFLRIEAHFYDGNRGVDRGVKVTLSAREIWRAGTAEAWTTDITDRYQENLERALVSLRDQWQRFVEFNTEDALPKTRKPATPREPIGSRNPDSMSRTSLQAGGRSSAAEKGTATALPAKGVEPLSRVGVWAFEAERIARGRGCELTERGAVLIDDRAGTELHHVSCVDRHAMRVQCTRSRCWVTR